MGSDLEDMDVNNLTYTISIHAPRMGSDNIRFAFGSAVSISIHAPRMGSDRSH